jgi:hypothetical protein
VCVCVCILYILICVQLGMCSVCVCVYVCACVCTWLVRVCVLFVQFGHRSFCYSLVCAGCVIDSQDDGPWIDSRQMVIAVIYRQPEFASHGYLGQGLSMILCCSRLLVIIISSRNAVAGIPSSPRWLHHSITTMGSP